MRICISAFLVVFLANALEAETYVTQVKVDVDRCASAWLISRFVDESPEFVFFDQGDEPPEGVTYDFFGAEYFHKGSDCTFTALIKSNGLSQNRALQRLNDVVNDVFAWRWPPRSFPVQLREHIAKLRELTFGDTEVYRDIFPVMDLLYLKYGGSIEPMNESGKLAIRLLPIRIVEPILSDHADANLHYIAAGFDQLVASSEEYDINQVIQVINTPHTEWSQEDKKTLMCLLKSDTLSASAEFLVYAKSSTLVRDHEPISQEIILFRQSINLD